MLKELLNKIKETPFVEEVLKRFEQARQQAEENIKRAYAKGGVVEPLTQRFELDNDEKIILAGEWKKNNPALYIDFEPLTRSVKQSAVSVQDLADAMRELARRAAQKEEERIKRQSANNWRKMHGLPMRRKVRRKK